MMQLPNTYLIANIVCICTIIMTNLSDLYNQQIIKEKSRQKTIKAIV